LYFDTNPRLQLLSNDGETAFVFDGKIHRVPLLRQGGPVGGEDIFWLTKSGPYSLTTSQSVHAQRSGYRRVFRDGNLRLLYASDSSRLIVAAPLTDKTLRLALIDLDARGNHPNEDYSIPEMGASHVPAVDATAVMGKPVWFVQTGMVNVPSTSSNRSGGVMERIAGNRTSLNRKVLGKVPAGMNVWAFDHETGLMIDAAFNSPLMVARLGGGKTRKVVCPGDGVPFLSRGRVFFAAKRSIHRLTDKYVWEKFCDYRLLALSADGKYWAVLDSDGSMLRARF
jgi:hypothetical protein